MNPGGVLPPASGRRTPKAARITRSLRRFLPVLALLVVALGVVGGAWLYADQRAVRRVAAELTARLEVERARREALERVIAESGERVRAYRQDVAPLLASRRDQLDRIERKVRALEMERNAGERIIEAYASGIPLIQGSVVYEDTAGRPLRYVRVDGKGRPVMGALGWPRMAANGEGPIVRTTFLGTGFLASRDGLILTSRHVARPWDADPALADLQQAGLRPRVAQLRAFFPGIPDPVSLSSVTASETADLIVLRGTPPRSVPVLPLDLEGVEATPGSRVIALGYPAGLDLLLMRVAPALLATLVDREVVEITDETVDIPTLLEKLSRAKQIHPYPTWGRLADSQPHQLAHDAGTGMGGSGGPIFAVSGRVIGLNTAVARDFDSAALGVPIREAKALLAQARRIAGPVRMR
jgi:S1-C subfamily serine protease